MAEGYSWNYVRSESRYRLPGPEHIGWWAAVAMLLSIALHILVFIALRRMEIALSFQQAEELRTRPVDVRQIEVRPMDEPSRPDPENVIKPPKDTASLMEEIDLLAALPKNEEIEIRTDIDQAALALQMKRPSESGQKTEIEMKAPEDLVMETELPDPGQVPVQLRPAEIGQVTVDPGARLEGEDWNKFAEGLIKKGEEGKVNQGVMDGVATLDALLELPSDLLLSKKTMLPSDLLFEFNSAELRESAKVGLMKLALLMDRNPGLYCWIEGHTDLIGSDSYNLELSRKRAESVKNYLVKSLRLEEQRIVTRGFGRAQPLVTSGTAEVQAPNRRVEIRMRKTLPPEESATETPAVPEPPRAVLVRPARPLPVEEAPPAAEPAPAIPVAEPVPEPAIPVAEPVVPQATPRAEVVEE